MSTKQDRRDKKRKKAKRQADKIVAEAIVKAKAKPALPTKWANERANCTDEEWVLGVHCRELREEGEPWWAIGRAMELEGYGNSAVTGKKGAARARTVYAKAFGSHPRTFTKGARDTLVPVNENVKALRQQKKVDRKEKAKKGKSVIPKTLSDQAVADMLKGKRIRWITHPFGDEATMDNEACIHPRAPLYIIGEGKKRQIEFHEEHRTAPVSVRWMPAHIRTVRLKNIYEVR